MEFALGVEKGAGGGAATVPPAQRLFPDRVGQVVNLLPAVGCAPGDENVLNSDLAQRRIRRIVLGLDDELYGEIRIILVENRADVFLELRIDAFAGAEDQDAFVGCACGTIRSHVAGRADTVEERDDPLNDRDRG